MKKLSESVLFVLMLFTIVSCTTKFEASPEYTTSQENGADYTITLHKLAFTSKYKDNDAMLMPLNRKLAEDDSIACEKIKTESVLFFKNYDEIIAKEKARLKELASKSKSKKQTEIAPIDTMRPEFKYELYNIDTAYIISPQIISVLNTSYVYSGGAHGITTFNSINYSPKNRSFYKPEEIIDFSKENEINVLLKKYFINPDSCFNTEPKLSLASAINVTQSTVMFTFSHYTLGAYYCGAPVVHVPIKELKDIYLIK